MNKHEFLQKFNQYVAFYPSIHSMGGQQTLIFSAGLDENLKNQIQFNSNASTFITLMSSTLSQWGKLNDGRDPLAEIIKVVMRSVGQQKRDIGQQLLEQLGESFDEESIENYEHTSVHTNVETVTIQVEIDCNLVSVVEQFLLAHKINRYVIFSQKKVVDM
jgi:Effector-associated domain 8